MNYREHGPPHFHAWYSGYDITVNIADGSVTGTMPKRATGLILDWWSVHQAELTMNWARAAAREPLVSIEPLE